MNNNIILIGMPGSGKSTVGIVLAKDLGMQFIDVDLVIQKAQNELLQKTLDRLGPDKFIELEADIVCTLKPNDCVISPGGSAVLTERGAKHLKSLGKMIYLKSSPDLLLAHIKNLSSRGIAIKPGQTFMDLYNYRAPIYEKYADITVDTDGKTLAQTVSSIEKLLNHRK